LANYTRLIELKVKDDALKRATVRLFRSLERIEKKLDVIGGKGGKGFTQVAKGAEKSAVAVEKLNKATVKLSTLSTGVRGSIKATAVALGLFGKGAYDTFNALSKLTGVYKPVGIGAGWIKSQMIGAKVALLGAAAAAPLLTKALVAGAAAYVIFGSKTGSVVKGLVKVERFAKKATQAVIEFVKKSKAPKGGEITIFDQIMSAKGGGLAGLQKLLDQVTAAQARLISTNSGYLAQTIQVREVEKALNAELMARRKILDGVILAEQRRVGIGSNIQEAGRAGGLEGLKRLLAEAESIQNRMLSTDEKYAEQSSKVRIIQSAINKELARREVLMGKLNIKEEKSVSLAERLRKAGAGFGGRVAREMRPGRGIERRGLAAAGIGGAAGLGMMANTGIGGFTGAGLGKVSGAASWMMGGIPGLHGAGAGLAKATTDITTLSAAAKGLGGIMASHPAILGTALAAWVAFGDKGIRKAIEKMFGLGKQTKKTTATLFELGKTTKLLTTGMSHDFKVSADAAKQLGNTAEVAFKKLDIAYRKQRLARARYEKGVSLGSGNIQRSGYGAWSARMDRQAATTAAFSDPARRSAAVTSHYDLRGERLAQLKGVGQQLTIEQRINKVLAKRGQILQGNRAVRQRGGGGMMSGFSGTRMGQAVLGGGFPLLFGGGPGAVLGGVAGGLMGGFAGGIGGSIIGQQLDRFVMAAAAVGKALQDPTTGLQKLSDMGIKVDESIKKQVESLVKLGNTFEAQLIIQREFAKIIGTKGVDDLQNLGEAFDELKEATSELFLIMSSQLAPAFTVVTELATKFVRALTGDATQRAASNLDRPAFVAAMKQARSFTNQQGVGTESTFNTRWKAIYNDKLTELSNLIVKKATPLDTSRGGSYGSGHAGIADVEGTNLKLLNQRIELLKVKDDLTNKELLDWEKKILHAETDVRLAEAANEGRSVALILKDHELKMLQLENGYVSELDEIYKDIAVTIEDGLVKAIEGAIKGTKTLGDVASSVLSQIANKMLKLGVNKLLTFLPFGLGEHFKADGGPVSGGTPYIVGEKGPELFVPNSSGNIVPNHAMGGSMVVNVDASGSSAEGDDDRSRQLGELIGAAVQSEIVRQQRPGGTLY
jgi:hypothetical protein